MLPQQVGPGDHSHQFLGSILDHRDAPDVVLQQNGFDLRHRQAGIHRLDVLLHPGLDGGTPPALFLDNLLLFPPLFFFGRRYAFVVVVVTSTVFFVLGFGFRLVFLFFLSLLFLSQPLLLLVPHALLGGRDFLVGDQTNHFVFFVDHRQGPDVVPVEEVFHLVFRHIRSDAQDGGRHEISHGGLLPQARLDELVDQIRHDNGGLRFIVQANRGGSRLGVATTAVLFQELA
mmetsp:Transcript_2424/g.5278  ORF Transcript_2424/g.5278 Transcript_2424/m.5278 type:complete len:230 (-) Transcript_2424:2484-3173(-)